MTNNTDTLNGALRELGETMADNLTTMGVPSTYDEGLTTLASKILQIGPTPPTPTPASVDLTGTKSILSYADSESCTLTATVLDSSDNPVEGVTVNLYNGSTLWDTLTTDSSGECSKTYSSAGSGDIVFTAEVDGTLLTKTYAVQDYWWYKPTLDSDFTRTITGSEYHYTLNNPITLPASFELKFTTTRASTSAGVVYFILGDDTTHTYSIGALRNKGSLSVRRDIDNTLIIDNNNNNIIPLAETENTYSYDGTKHTVQSSVTLTGNDANATVGKFLKVVVNTQCSFKGIKIKPL